MKKILEEELSYLERQKKTYTRTGNTHMVEHLDVEIAKVKQKLKKGGKDETNKSN